ncbi:MAG: DUF4344 domain-containing metallopeptidase, partial [Bacteroidota bacterium]
LLASGAATAQPIDLRSGDRVDGTLGPGDEVLGSDGSYYDVYVYRGRPNEEITITLRSSDFDAYLLGGPSLADAVAAFEEDDDGGGGTDAELITTTNASGDYYVLANTYDAGEGGAYVLGASAVRGRFDGGFDDGASGGDTIRDGQTIEGDLSRSDDQLPDESYVDLYTYEGTPGESVTFTLRSTDFDAFLAVGPIRGGVMTPEAYDDDSAGGTDSELTVQVGFDGTIGVRANSLRAGETGAYTLSASASGGGGMAGLTPIYAGDDVPGSLSASDPRLSDESHYDLYEFVGSAYEEIEITLASSDFDAYLGGGATPDDAIRGTDQDDDSAGGTDAQLRVQADASGRYVIRANSLRAGATGAYTLSVRSASGTMVGADAIPALALGRSVSGTLASGDETLGDGTYVDMFTYAGSPGEEIEITMTSPDFDTYLILSRVFGGEIETVAEDDDGGEGLNSTIRATLNQSGTYVVLANSAFADNSGSYTLTLSRPGGAPSEDAGSGLVLLRTGQIQNGRLETSDTELADASFADTYVYRGAPGETVLITLRSDDFDAFLGVASITGDDVEAVARDDDSAGNGDAQVRLTIAGSGVYAIQANSYGPGETGAYTLLVERAGSVAPPSTRSGDSRFAGKWAPATYRPTTEFASIRDMSRRERRLEGTAESLNASYPLPRNVSLAFEECGQPNAYYSPRDAAVAFCYEMFGFLQSTLGSQVEASRLDEAINGAYEFIMLHEVGHALTDQLDLPITGREEDVADQFAALMLIRQGTKGARAAIDGVLALQQGDDFSTSDYAGEHSLGPVRLYNVVCLVYGSDPQKYAGLVGPNGLPEDRAVRCPGEFQQVEKAFDRLLGFVYNE